MLDPGKTTVGIDMAAQSAYLVSIGVDISELTDQQIKEYNTGDKVFIAASVKILDTIEDVKLTFAI